MTTEEKNEELATTLNDLVKINNDRIEGYRKAAHQCERNALLKMMFEEKATHSEKFVRELRQLVADIGGDQTNETTLSGKIFRGWMDLKNALHPGDTPTIVDSCEFGEEAALKAYEQALRADTELDEKIKAKITEQKKSIQTSYEQLQNIGHRLNKINL